MKFSLPLLALIAGASASTRYVFTAYKDTTCSTPVETGKMMEIGYCWENINVDPNGAVQIFYGLNAKVVGWSNADCTGDVVFTAVTDGVTAVNCAALNGVQPRSFSNPA